MEADSSQSLVTIGRDGTPKPSRLHPYWDQSLASLDTLKGFEGGGTPAVCSMSASQADCLLIRWTSLPQFESRLQDEERELQRQRYETQQATVESDSDGEQSRSSKLSSDGARRQRRSGSIQPLFTEANSNPSPVSGKQFGPSAPHTLATTLRTSRDSLPPSGNDQYASASPRSSVGSLPVEAAAAVEAKEEDNEADLEIPWVLCTRKYYWKFIDARKVDSNTDQAPSLAFLERNSWTEIMASWVTKEAIREAGFRFTQVQKDKREGRRTKSETCFCIERPLQFDQVKHLVERTVEMYRKTAPPFLLAPQARRSSFQRPPPPPNVPKGVLKGSALDRDRTPVPRTTYPPLDRTNSSIHLPPPPGPPPSLDRSLSMPGPGLGPPLPQAGMSPQTLNLQLPVPPLGQYANQQPPRAQSPRIPQYPPQTNGYPSQPTNANGPYYPPPPFGNPSFPLNPQLQNQNYPIQQSPLRQSYMNPLPNRTYDDGFTTSDSEAERPRRRRSKSQSRYNYDRERDGGKKKSSTGRKAAGTLLGVGGLAALLDGLSGL
jgi:hypothetical protein